MTLRIVAALLLPVLLFPSLLPGAEDTVADKLLEAARKGDVPSQVKLAAEYFSGRNRVVNPHLGAYWFRKAAGSGDAFARYNYALCLLNGWGVKKSAQTAFLWLGRAAEQNFIPAQILHAEMLFNGVAAEESDDYRLPQIASDRETALKTLRKLAVAGSPAASGKLARLLLSVPELRDSAAQEIRSAASFAASKLKRDPEVILLYSAVLQGGIGGSCDMKAAAALLEGIVDISPEAAAQLAEFYEFGFGVPADRKKALELTLKAAASGSPRAMISLGNRCLDGNGVEHDPAKAFQLFDKAWRTGYPRSASALGKCYLNGIGTGKDPARAFELFLMGAHAGDPESQYQLGLCFMGAVGTRMDIKSGAYWLKVASQSFHTEAMREYALCLLEGKGVEADRVQAAKLLRRSAARGDVKSVEVLNRESIQ